MKNLLLMFLTILGCGKLSSQCDYTINMQDSWGDGWNGASISVDVNGINISTVTLNTGSSGSESFSTYTGDVVQFSFTGGSYDSEITLQINDPSGTQIYSGGAPIIGPFLTNTSNSTCAPPSCTAPTGIVSSNILADGADINWTSGATESAWNLEYGTSGYTQGTGTSIALTATNYSITGLLSNTTYDVYVQADCGSDQSPWSGPHSFNTACGSITTFPHNEDFTSGNTSLNCWEVVNGGDANTWVFSTNGEAAIQYSSTAHDDYLISPKWNIQAGTSDRITFEARNQSGSWAEEFDLLLSTSGTSPADFTETIATNLVPPTTNQSYTYDLAAYIGQDVHLAFHSTTTDLYALYIDNFEIQGIPACLAPSGLASSNVSTTGADVSWTAGATESAWNLEYGASGYTQGTGTTVALTASSYSLSGLTPQTSYDVYVQADCGSGQSSWVGPLSISTPCVASSAPYDEGFENAGAIPSCWSMSGGEDWLFNTSGPNHVGNAGTITGSTTSGNYYAVVDASGYTGDATLTSPIIDVSSLTSAELTFYLISDDEGSGYSSTLTVTANGNTVVTYSGNTSGWEQKIIDLSAYTTTVQLSFIFSEVSDGSAYYDDIAIDDVSVHETPSCPAPTAFVSSNISATGANINWTAGATESAWNLEYGASGYTQGTGTSIALTATNYSITGLLSNTTYDVYVQADCGSDQSSWTGPLTLTTPCGSITTFPHNEDFTTGNVSLNCWEVVNGGDANTWVFSTNAEAAIQYSSTAHNDYLISPSWLVQEGISNQISFDARNLDMSYPEQFDVLLSTTGTNPSDFTNTLASNVVPPSANQTYTYNISAYVGQNVYIAIHNTTTNQYVMYVDNFKIDGLQAVIPDDNFEAYLEANGMGDGITNNDSVSIANITNVKKLDVSNQNISDLSGISYFTELIILDCENNSLTSLDITQNSNLEKLNCRYNQISNIDLSQNTALSTLNLSDNNFSTINISQNTGLEQLSCEDNLLTSLDVSNNTSLRYFICGDNQLTNLNISANAALTYLGCHANQLTSLDVSNNAALEVLSFGKNQLSAIDVSNNTSLNEIRCYENQLISLDLSSNINLTKIDLSYNPLTCLNLKNGFNTNIVVFNSKKNPNLNCIEVDNPSWSTSNWLNVDSNLNFSTNCSYPAGCF